MKTREPVAKFGHAFRSEDLNNSSRDLYQDLKEAYLHIEEVEKESQIMKDSHTADLAQMQAHIASLNRYVEQLENMVASSGQTMRRALLNGVDMITSYPDAGQDGSDKQARGTVYHEEAVSGLTPIRKSSKLTMRTQEGVEVAPDAVGVRVARTNNGGEVRDEGSRSVLDGTGIWRRVVSYDASVSPLFEDAIYEVDVPMLTGGNREVNEIVVEGYPFRGVRVTDVLLEVYGKWESVPIKRRTYESDSAMGAMRLRFPDQPATRVRIHLRQERVQRRGTKALFEIGLKRLEVNRLSYDDEVQVMLGKISIPGSKGIQSIEGRFENEVSKHQYTFELCRMVSGILIPIDASQWQSLTDKELWIRTALQYDANRRVAPMLQHIEVLLVRKI